MIKFDLEKIKGLEKIYRLNLINSCTGYKSANLIGSSLENVEILKKHCSGPLVVGGESLLLLSRLRLARLIPPSEK